MKKYISQAFRKGGLEIFTQNLYGRCCYSSRFFKVQPIYFSYSTSDSSSSNISDDIEENLPKNPVVLNVEKENMEKPKPKKPFQKKFMLWTYVIVLLSISGYAFRKRREIRKFILRKKRKNDVILIDKNGKEMKMTGEQGEILRKFLEKCENDGIPIEDVLFQIVQERTNLENEFEKILEEKEKEHIMELENTQGDIKNEMEMKYYTKNETRINKLKKLTLKVTALENLYITKTKYLKNAKKFQELSLLTLSLSKLLSMHYVPIKPEIDSLKKAAEGDQLLEIVLKEIPMDVQKNGISCLSNLYEELCEIEKKVIKASYKPKDAGRGGRLYHWFAKKVVFLKDGEMDLTISRAKKFLQRGMLQSAINELDKIEQEESKKVLNTWMKNAKKRRDVSLLLEIIVNHLMNLSHSIN